MGTAFLMYFVKAIADVIGFEVFRTQRKWKYKRVGSACTAWLKNLTKEGCVNSVGLLLLLNAMEASCTTRIKDVDKLRKEFELAIVSITRSGFKSIAALASEKAGEAMRREGEHYWSSYYLRQATQLYQEWGATIKVDQMWTKHGASLVEGSSFTGESAILGRQRFEEMPVAPRSLHFAS